MPGGSMYSINPRTSSDGVVLFGAFDLLTCDSSSGADLGILRLDQVVTTQGSRTSPSSSRTTLNSRPTTGWVASRPL